MRKILIFLIGLVLCTVLTNAQSKTITGNVTDSKGAPVPGVTIKIKGSKGGTSADANGAFRINAPANATLIISGIGFATKEVKVGNLDNLTIALSQSEANLSEVVVTALGIKRDKRLLTYATQEVKGAALVEAKQDNLVNALAGKVAGVQITNSSGMPGSSSRIVIRGNTSLMGENRALFVIDGVPMYDNEQGNPADNSLFAGGTTDRASDIDPNIIESITVLKGTAATALYGSAAARGAVLITTKNGMGGKSGKPTVTVGSSYSFANPILPQIQDMYAQGTNGVYYDGNAGQVSSTSWGPRIDTLLVNGQHVQKRNNVKDFFQTGHTTDNNISVSGASDRSSYLASYSFLKTDGTEPTTNYDRHSFFFKVGTKVTNNLTLNVQFNYIHSDNHRLLEGNGLSNPLWTVYAAPISWNPLPYLNPDGSQQLYRTGRNNPYWLVNNTGLEDKVNRILPVVSLVYSPLSWLSVTERLGTDMYEENINYHENTGIYGNFPQGRVYTSDNQYIRFNNDLIVEAKKQLTHDLFGDVVVGNNILTNYNSTNFTQGTQLGVPGLYTIANTNNVAADYTSFQTRKVGFYAQATLEYMKMITLNLTGRYDGSSVLSQTKQFYPYGSASLGFIFTQALGLATNPVLNFGKVRVSYSAVGNDNVGAYQLTTPYVQNGPNSPVGNVTFPLNGQNGFTISNTYAFPLKNENVSEFETGLETKWFQNRVSLDVTYFNKKSSNLLSIGTPVAPATGYSAVNINSGAIQNKGVEIMFAVTPVRTRNFTWDLNANFTKIHDEVTSLAPGLPYIQFAGFINPGIFAFAGQPYGVIYGTHFLKNTAGQLLLDDNFLPQVANDLAPIGNVTPKYNLGVTNTLTYKAFSFSFTLDYKHGGDVLNLDNHYLVGYGMSRNTESRGTSHLFDGIVQSTGKINTTPAVLSQDFYTTVYASADQTSVEDGSYLKLRQATFAYNFASTLLKGSVFKGLALTVTGTNFILFKNYTGSDPEVSLNGSGNGQGFGNFMVPGNHNIIVGLKATF